MPVVHCYFCDQTYQAPDAARGKQVVCRNCFRKLDVPLVDALPPTPAAADIPGLKPDESAELKAAKAAAKLSAKSPPRQPVVSEPTMEVAPPKPAAPLAKVIPSPKPKATASSPAESDRWDFDATMFDAAGGESQEFGTLPPAIGKKKKKSRFKWKWTLPNIKFRDTLDPWEPFAQHMDTAVLVCTCAGLTSLFLAIVAPWWLAYCFLWVLWAIIGMHFVDACFDGGLMRVFLIYSIPGIVIALSLLGFEYQFRSTPFLSIVVGSIYFPYVLYIIVLRFRYIWPVNILAIVLLVSPWIARQATRAEWVVNLRKNAVEWLPPLDRNDPVRLNPLWRP